MPIPLEARRELHTIALMECLAQEWEIVHPGPCNCEYCCWRVKFHTARLLAVISPEVHQ